MFRRRRRRRGESAGAVEWMNVLCVVVVVLVLVDLQTTCVRVLSICADVATTLPERQVSTVERTIGRTDDERWEAVCLAAAAGR